jgi:hypothetical protein
MARGVWELWADVPEPTRTELRAVYRDLRLAHGGFRTRLVRRYAKAVAELWLVADRASQEAARLAGQRRAGKWKRSTRRLVTGAMKRQALELYSLDQARQQLAALTGRNGHGGHTGANGASVPASPAELLATLRRDGDG